MEATFKPGDRVMIISENTEVDLDDYGLEAENLGDHDIPIGTEFVIPDDPEDRYDGYDNSWLLRGDGHNRWVHEGALDYAITPVTQDEEAEALASIMEAFRE